MSEVIIGVSTDLNISWIEEAIQSVAVLSHHFSHIHQSALFALPLSEVTF